MFLARKLDTDSEPQIWEIDPLEVAFPAARHTRSSDVRIVQRTPRRWRFGERLVRSERQGWSSDQQGTYYPRWAGPGTAAIGRSAAEALALLTKTE